MRVLQINCEYKTGSTGKIADCISLGLKKSGHEVYTCYGLNKGPNDGESTCICTRIEHRFNALYCRITGIPFGGYYNANRKFEKIITKYKPDIIHVHCINCYTINIYKLLEYLGRNNLKTVVTLHAEFFFTGGCAHSFDCTQWITGCQVCSSYKKKANSWFFDRAKISWKKMKSAFDCFSSQNLKVVAVSPWLEKRAKESAILKSFNVSCVCNGVNTDVFTYNETISNVLKTKRSCKNILFVSAHFTTDDCDPKGGKYLVELARTTPEHNFIVAARHSNVNAKELPTNIIFLGNINNQLELAQLYSSVDATIILGKRETFSMVVAESLCCGTPVIGFLAGGPESIGMPEFTKFVSYGNIQELREALDIILMKDISKKELSFQAKQIYSESNMFNGYYNLYKDFSR